MAVDTPWRKGASVRHARQVGFPATHAPRADFQTAARKQFLVAEGFAATMLL
jgi:hypothetical protein